MRSDELSHRPRSDNGRLRRDLPLAAISPRSGDSHAGPRYAPDLQEIQHPGWLHRRKHKENRGAVFVASTRSNTSVGSQFERKVLCHTTKTKEMPSLLDGNQIPLMIGRIPRTRIPRSATPFPAIRILRCLRPNLSEILHLIRTADPWRRSSATRAVTSDSGSRNRTFDS